MSIYISEPVTTLTGVGGYSFTTTTWPYVGRHRK